MSSENVRKFEIPREEWPEFVLGFGTSHKNWRLDITHFDTNDIKTVLADNAPMQNFVLEDEGDLNLLVVTSENAEKTVTHKIQNPQYMIMEETADGGHKALEIINEDMETTLLRFRSAMPPTMVDGKVS
ncbi:MAG TPA: hypothetical protein ENO22_06195 [candidate division Zixibacteria bacterium]|nr:hypothetical protein [candidate division Zixibacteria bacterium]